jgi:large-conductance mechanosensitive channel
MDDENLDTLAQRSVWFVIVLTVLLTVFYGIWFVGFNGQRLAKDAAAWGQFGDFVGGVLNPVIAFAAFFWLAKSVRLQKKELDKTRKTLADTLAEQKEQAKTVLVSTKLQYLNIQIASINSQIQNERAYINQLIQQAQTNGTAYTVIDKLGEYKKLEVLLPSLNSAIDALSSERDKHVKLAKEIAPDLTT